MTPRRRIALAALIVVPLTGCVSWQPLPVSPGQEAEGGLPDWMRVTLHDGSRVEVNDPAIENDTLRADLRCRPGQCVGGPLGLSVTVPLDEIQALESRRISSSGTALMLGVLTGLGILFGATFGQGLSPFGS